MLMSKYCFDTVHSNQDTFLSGVIHDTRIHVKIYYRPRTYNTSLIFIVLQITSIPHLSVLELSEAARVSCGSFDQRGRRERLASYRPAAPLLLMSLPVLGPEIEGGSVCVGQSREDKLTVQCSNAGYSTAHCTVLYCTVPRMSAGFPLAPALREGKFCPAPLWPEPSVHSHTSISNLFSMML